MKEEEAFVAERNPQAIKFTNNLVRAVWVEMTTLMPAQCCSVTPLILPSLCHLSCPSTAKPGCPSCLCAARLSYHS